MHLQLWQICLYINSSLMHGKCFNVSIPWQRILSCIQMVWMWTPHSFCITWTAPFQEKYYTSQKRTDKLLIQFLKKSFWSSNLCSMLSAKKQLTSEISLKIVILHQLHFVADAVLKLENLKKVCKSNALLQKLWGERERAHTYQMQGSPKWSYLH